MKANVEIHQPVQMSYSYHKKISKAEFLDYCSQYPSKIYQDIYINGEVVFRGVNQCDARYEMIRPILQLYRRYFSVLDLGAAQGYFSFRIGSEFPKSECVMVEHQNEQEMHYKHHQDMLFQLCHLNTNLKNITYLNREISLKFLEDLQSEEHFDLILALLVIHQVDKSMDVRIKLLDKLLQLGDHLILEVSNDVAPELWEYVREKLFQRETHDCKYLGEVIRYYDPGSSRFPNGKGHFYWFSRKMHGNNAYDHPLPQRIHWRTFKAMNGVFTSSSLF